MIPTNVDLICLSHLRWGFVYQRPQHLMSRFARERRVFFVEEPLWDESGAVPRLAVSESPEGVTVAVPHLPERLAADPAAAEETVADLLSDLLAERGSGGQVLWTWTPMALPWARDLSPAAVVYDCMDELA